MFMMTRYYLSIILIISVTIARAQSAQLLVPLADSKIYVETHGTGQPILFLHAGNMDHRMWQDQVKAFEKTHRVILMDLRGCGATVDGDSTYWQSAAIKAVLDTLRLNRITIVGSSLGAVSAVAFALDYPESVSRLALVSPGLIGLDLNQDPKLVAYNEEMYAAYKAGAWDKYAALFVQAWVDGPKRSTAEVNAGVRQKALAMVTENVTKRKPGVHPGFRLEPTQAQRLSELTMPVSVFLGGLDMADIKIAAEKYRSAGAEVITFGKAAHLINMEDPKAFNKALAEFLQR
jgi:pimeloyl-ACP methyl ester carboxylesterase